MAYSTGLGRLAYICSTLHSGKQILDWSEKDSRGQNLFSAMSEMKKKTFYNIDVRTRSARRSSSRPTDPGTMKLTPEDLNR